MLERDVEKRLHGPIKDLGGMYLKFVCPSFTGVPDRLILLPGARLVFVELKKPGGKERPRQVYVQERIRRLGFTVFSAVDTPERIQEVIDYCKREVEADAVQTL